MSHFLSYQYDSDCDASDNSEVSNFGVPPQTLDASLMCSTRPKLSASHTSPTATRSQRGSARPSPRGSAASPAGKESPRVTSPNSKCSPQGTGRGKVLRSPKELFDSCSSLAAGSPPTGFRSSPKRQQFLQQSEVNDESEQHSRASSSIKLKDYLDDPLMTLRTNREHSDLVIRERDDEPHLRFMSLHFTPATPQAVEAFRSDWSEERDALLQDDVFLNNKRAVFFCVFSDKQSLHSQSVKAHILRASEVQTAASDPDGIGSQLISGVDYNGSSDHHDVAAQSSMPLSASSSTPVLDAVTLDGSSVSRCHAVIHNADTGASAICKMRFDIDASAAECLADLPLAPLPASSAKHTRPGQWRKGRPPSAASPSAEDSPLPSTEMRSHSFVTLSGLGKDKTKCCIVPNMQKGETCHFSASNAPDMIMPALGNVGQGDVEEFEGFYSKEWEGLGPVDREIRFQQLQLLKLAKQNTVYRNFVADALHAEIVAKSSNQRFPVADQKNIETALVVSSRSRQLQITMEAGLQPRYPGTSLPGDPESEGDDAVCCVCFCGESLDDNQIVFCEGCNMAVHQSCYGIKSIPDGDWFCDSCVLSCKPTCTICRKKDGAFKLCIGARSSAVVSQSENGIPPQGSRESKQWVHVLCALWHPEVSFESLAIMREADLSKAEFFSKKHCVFCNQNGYLLLCPGKCRQHYHPMCAWLGGWFIEYSATPKLHSLSRKRESERTLQAVSPVALIEHTKYVPPMVIAAKCSQCLDASRRKAFDPNHNSKIRQLLSQVPASSGSKTSKRGSAAILEDDSGRRMLHLVRRTFLPPDEFPLGVCMICHFDVHNENRRKLRRSRLLICSRGCGASVHEGCANMLPDDGSIEDDGSWTCMLCQEQESLGSVECMLCPRRGGLFQRCSEYPGWLHCICARLLCNIRPGFKGFSISEPVNTGTMIQDYRDAKSKKVCCVCRQPGKVLHCCAHPGCEKHLHPICAMIKQCKSSFDNSKNGKNNCTLLCAQHSPVVDFAAADALALQEDAKNYARLLDLRIHLDKMRDLVNFSKRRERWKHHLDQKDMEIMEQYEQRMQLGDASLCSAAVLAPPSISENEPVLDAAIAECDNSAAEDFLPRKREKGQSIWFDVPIRGGIGMIHVSKRKCPEIMFRYLDHLSKVEGRKGWSFVSKEDGPLMSPAKLLNHQSRSGKTIFPPSPATASALHPGISPRVSRLGKEHMHSPAAFNGFPPSPNDPFNDRLTRSSQRGLSFGSCVNASLDEDYNASDTEKIERAPAIVYPRGTLIEVFSGRFKGRSGEIVGYSAVGWYTASFKGIKEDCKVRSNCFRVA